jgi:3-methylcrotonyl-CoA carboxylase alpha subunit
MNYEFIYNGETKTVELKDNRMATIGDKAAPVEIDYTPDGRIFLRSDGKVKEIFAVTNGDKTYVDIDGTLFEFAIPSDEVGADGGAGGLDSDPSKIFAPMPGKIVKLMVAEGDPVEPKKHLVIVEAMKMEHIVVAKGTGKVKAVNFALGDQVDTDNPIMELELNE